jgi:hypothetical protein
MSTFPLVPHWLNALPCPDRAPLFSSDNTNVTILYAEKAVTPEIWAWLVKLPYCTTRGVESLEGSVENFLQVGLAGPYDTCTNAF